MKKLFSILAFVLCSFMVNAQTWPPPAGMQGDGSMGNPWQIRSAEHLADLANFVNASSVNANATKGKHYRIMNDIDLTDFLKAQSHSRGWQPIGVGLDIFANQRRAFQGYMHGGGHVISGLWIHRYCENANHFEHFFNGLFGIIENATIDSLGVEVAEGDSIVGANYTGILVGSAYWNNNIRECYVKGKVKGQNTTGGMVGLLSGSHIENCYSQAGVYGISQGKGGLVGHIYYGGSVKYSYAAGYVEGYLGIGGLVGQTRHQSPVIQNCVVAKSHLTGNDNIGKIVGYNFEATPTILHCFTNSDVAVSGNGGYHDGIDDRNLDDFKTQSFYTNRSNWAGDPWDFDHVWLALPGDYPALRWQSLAIIPPMVLNVEINTKSIQADNNNTFKYDVDCDDDIAEITIDAGDFATVTIAGTPRNTITWELIEDGDNHIPFMVTPFMGEPQPYTISINKPVPFDQVVVQRWGNTLTVINNPANNGGHIFETFQWYQNGIPVGNKQSWTVGHTGETLKPTDLFRVELTALGRSGQIRSCESSVTTQKIELVVYPNPVPKGETLIVEIDMDEEFLKDAYIDIFNQSGQLVETMSASQQTSINVRY
ncbi:MAG: hypothetical protein FWG79_05565, partial [Bacteroidales bacterium]|nr:hypothetical protein [Bacteroidales bacterium]